MYKSYINNTFFLNYGLWLNHSNLFECYPNCVSSNQPLIHNQKIRHVKMFKKIMGYGKGKLINPKSLSPIFTNFNLNVKEHVHLVSKLN